MEPDNQAISAEILIEVEGTVMHRFVNKDKSMFTSGINSLNLGTCKIAKIENPQHRI